MTNEKIAEIRARCEAAKGVRKYVENYHAQEIIYASVKDIPILPSALNIAKKTCPKGGNDGYITPRPCQCEVESLEADRDRWKARAETLEIVIRAGKECQICRFRDVNPKELPCCECCNSPTEINERTFWQFDEARFMGGEK